MAAGYFIFTPANDDPSDQALRIGGNYVPAAFGLDRSAVSYATPGGGLGGVHRCDPALLIIFGHGNMGLGIGSHHTYYNESRLVTLLQDAGLSAAQTNLTIYLWACNTGVTMPGKVFSNDPFAKRFASRLASTGFTHTRVIGIAGFILGSSDSAVLAYDMKTNRPDLTASRKPPTDITRQIAYAVESGSSSRLSGASWNCTYQRATQRYVVTGG